MIRFPGGRLVLRGRWDGSPSVSTGNWLMTPSPEMSSTSSPDESRMRQRRDRSCTVFSGLRSPAAFCCDVASSAIRMLHTHHQRACALLHCMTPEMQRNRKPAPQLVSIGYDTAFEEVHEAARTSMQKSRWGAGCPRSAAWSARE